MKTLNVKTPINWIGVGLALFTLVVAPAAAEVENTSYTAADGSRVLRHEGIVDAPVASVWKAFTTTDGVISWMVPRAVVDFGIGGTMEASYSLDAEFPSPDNIKHEFLAYLPNEMIAMRVIQCPPGTPHEEILEKLWAVITFEPVGEDRTRVAIAGVGYGEGEGYDAVYDFFDQGNAWTFTQLQKLFQEGPIDWQRKRDEALESVKESGR